LEYGLLILIFIVVIVVVRLFYLELNLKKMLEKQQGTNDRLDLIIKFLNNKNKGNGNNLD